MLLYLLAQDELRGLVADLGYEVSEEQVARTVDYYLARTSHRPTLSSVATAWILAWYAPRRLAPQIKHLRFSVHYRGYRVELVFSEDHLGVSSRPGPAAPVTVLIPNTPLSCARARGIHFSTSTGSGSP